MNAGRRLHHPAGRRWARRGLALRARRGLALRARRGLALRARWGLALALAAAPAPAAATPPPKSGGPVATTPPSNTRAATNPRPRAPSLDEVLRALARPRTIQGQFAQVRTSKAFLTPQEATGRIYLARPARLRLEYLIPGRSLLVASGGKVTLSYPELGEKQTFDRDSDPGIGVIFDTVLAFADADPERLRAVFDLEQAADDPAHVILTPRRPKGEGVGSAAGPEARTPVERIELWADLERGTLRRLRMVDRRGGATEWRFSDLQVDAPVAEALFAP